MKRLTLIICILFLFLACKSKEKDKSLDSDIIESGKTEQHMSMPGQKDESKKNDIYTFDRLKQEFKETFKFTEDPIGIYFWDEFEDLKSQYRLAEDESKLLGKWFNVDYMGNIHNFYYFYPNKLFILNFKYQNYQYLSNGENMYFFHAIGTWEIVSSFVQFTIFAIIIDNASEDYLSRIKERKSILFIEPYTVDFIKVDDIGEEGFTKRPINDTVFSDKLEQIVRIKKPNKTNNLYIRTVYSIALITNSGRPEKTYRYFDIVRDMAQENLSGLDIVTNEELIKKYIFDLWY